MIVCSMLYATILMEVTRVNVSLDLKEMELTVHVCYVHVS